MIVKIKTVIILTKLINMFSLLNELLVLSLQLFFSAVLSERSVTPIGTISSGLPCDGEIEELYGLGGVSQLSPRPSNIPVCQEIVGCKNIDVKRADGPSLSRFCWDSSMAFQASHSALHMTWAACPSEFAWPFNDVLAIQPPNFPCGSVSEHMRHWTSFLVLSSWNPVWKSWVYQAI